MMNHKDTGSRAGLAVYSLRNRKISFLVVREKTSGFWGFPKGSIREGETPYECAYREFKEECGVGIHSEPVGKIYNKSIDYTLYIATEVCKPKTRTKEIKSITWMTLDELLETNISNSTRKIVIQLQEKLDEIIDKAPAKQS